MRFAYVAPAALLLLAAAGCNHFRASYTLAGDSLRFGPALATKMACADADDLGTQFPGGSAAGEDV